MKRAITLALTVALIGGLMFAGFAGTAAAQADADSNVSVDQESEAETNIETEQENDVEDTTTIFENDAEVDSEAEASDDDGLLSGDVTTIVGDILDEIFGGNGGPPL